MREKEFNVVPLTLAQALDEMELVGHDFFLYQDATTGRPSVVYRGGLTTTVCCIWPSSPVTQRSARRRMVGGQTAVRGDRRRHRPVEAVAGPDHGGGIPCDG